MTKKTVEMVLWALIVWVVALNFEAFWIVLRVAGGLAQFLMRGNYGDMTDV